jgi:hypothetical protein
MAIAPGFVGDFVIGFLLLDWLPPGSFILISGVKPIALDHKAALITR